LRVLLAPRLPALRLPEIDDRAARRLYRGFLCIATVVVSAALINSFLLGINLAPPLQLVCSELLLILALVAISTVICTQRRAIALLVRDILSGVFFLFDDAFRIGEYVDVGEGKGTVERMSLLGLTDVEIAQQFGIGDTTLNRWKEEYPEFRESLNDGKTPYDAEVAVSMGQRARGYEQPAVKIFMPSGADEPVYAPHTEHAFADVNAG
jgi:Mechanosensitive ion channel